MVAARTHSDFTAHSTGKSANGHTELVRLPCRFRRFSALDPCRIPPTGNHPDRIFPSRRSTDDHQGMVGGRLARSARRRYQGSLPQEFVTRLNELDFLNTIVLFGGAVLFSLLPLIILMSSFANAR